MSHAPLSASEKSAAEKPAATEFEREFGTKIPESCAGCGLCCQGIGSPVLIYQTQLRSDAPHPFRPADLPAELIAEIDEHFQGLTRGQEPLQQCLWFDATLKQCKHYEWRPQICRDYELAGTACLLRRQQAVQEWIEKE